MFVVGTHNEFYKTLFSALAAVHDIFVPLTLWAADRGKKEGEHQTRRLLYTADKIIKQWNTFSQRILTESDETLFLHNEDRESARQAYKRRWYEWMGFVDNALRALSKENVREDHEGTESLEKHLIHKWRREGQLTFHELQKKGGFKWGMRV